MRILTICLLSSALAASASAQDWKTFDGLVQSLGLDDGVTDLSLYESISIDEPRMAYVNITGTSVMPSNKSTYYNGWVDVYDGQGHYFRKRMRIHGQGGYSIRYAKKNFSLKLCEDDYSERNTTSLIIGDWVSQDSYHFKAFWTDFSRGIGEIGYKVFATLTADREPYWDRGGYHEPSRARCFPDGFPCAVYLEGNFYGIFSWQLKKHRKNMNMKKTQARHVHIDGTTNDKTLFQGKIQWNQFEVRNPANLYTQSGTAYNGNTPSELMGEDSPSYSKADDDPATTAAKQRSAQVKGMVKALSRYHSQLSAIEAGGAGNELMRSEIASRYDIGSMVDYAVFYHLSANCDGSLKNWQWFTYDGKLWMVAPYDLDQTFGINLYGVVRPATFPVSELTTGPFYWIDRYFYEDVRMRYAHLRQSGVISSDNLVPIASDWCDRVGDTFYDMEKDKWPLSPCYCDAVCNGPWQPYDEWGLYGDALDYNPGTTYQAGDFCKLEGRLWQTTAEVCGIRPFQRNANIDTRERLEAWIPERIEYLDEKYGYDESDGIETVQNTESITYGQIAAVYDINGNRVDTDNMDRKGIYIVRYANGVTRKVLVR